MFCLKDETLVFGLSVKRGRTKFAIWYSEKDVEDYRQP